MSAKRTGGVVCAVSAIIAIVASLTLDGGGPRTEQSSLYPDGNTLRLSTAAMEIIGDAEGCRREPYHCPAGLLTIGLGHTGSDVRPGQHLSDRQIAAVFQEDLLKAQWCLEHFVEARTGEPLPPSVMDAYASFVFNMGCAKFRSYPVYQLLVAEQYEAACERMRRYNGATVNGQFTRLPGLVTRRNKEADLCLASLN